MASSTFTTLCNHHHNLFPKLFRHLKLKLCNHETTGTLLFHLKDEQLVVVGGGGKRNCPAQISYLPSKSPLPWLHLLES